MHERVMPFGKHEGKPIADVPRGYLRWLRSNLTLHGQLAEDIERAIEGRPLRPTFRDQELEADRIVQCR